jgi:predicted nucleotidyltransferase
MEPLYKKTLNPKFWSNNNFDKGVSDKLLKLVLDFIKEVKLEVPIKDVTLTGSLANFNYNKYSDFDIHILLDFKKINDDINLVKDALDGKRFVWNLRHNIFIRGHEVELYFQDINDPHFATAIYSILREKWIKEPVYNPPGDVDVNEVESKANDVDDFVNRMINKLNETTDRQEIQLINKKAKLIKDKIIGIRKEALAERGEFAFENLLFKKLRNKGVIEKIIDVINASYDKLFTESKFLAGIANFIKNHL